MTRTALDFLADIRDAAINARKFVAGMSYEQFVADTKTVFAAVRALEIVGEAAKRIPPDVRQKAPDIPWRAMAGIRDKLIHDYVSVDPEIVWRTIGDDLPGLEAQIEQLLNALSPNQSFGGAT
jgi:uncharacterized protein with HEPN domain